MCVGEVCGRGCNGGCGRMATATAVATTLAMATAMGQKLDGDGSRRKWVGRGRRERRQAMAGGSASARRRGGQAPAVSAGSASTHRGAARDGKRRSLHGHGENCRPDELRREWTRGEGWAMPECSTQRRAAAGGMAQALHGRQLDDRRRDRRCGEPPPPHRSPLPGPTTRTSSRTCHRGKAGAPPGVGTDGRRCGRWLVAEHARRHARPSPWKAPSRCGGGLGERSLLRVLGDLILAPAARAYA